MAFSHLSLDTDKYEIFISNNSAEDNLQPDEMSSASSWTTTLDSSIDLSSLLYLKASSAEVCVSQFNIDSLPMCFIETEKLTVNLTIPEDVALCNQHYGSDALKNRFNPVPYIIPLENFATSEAEMAINFLNEKLSIPMSHFVLRSYLRIVLDTEIFIEHVSTTLSLDDVNLILKYLDCILFSRDIVHQHLFSLIEATITNLSPTNPSSTSITDPSPTSITNPSPTNPSPTSITDYAPIKITFHHKGAMITETKEKEFIKASTTLRPVEERPQPRNPSNMDLTLFYGVNLQNAYTAETGPKNTVISRTDTWLSNLAIIERVNENDPNSNLTTDSLDDMKKIITSNKILISQAIKAREVLTLLKTHIDKRNKQSTSQLFHSAPITLSLDPGKSKLRFQDNTNLFLANDKTSVTLTFPPYCSYKLGANKGEIITIGPIPRQKATNEKIPKLTNNMIDPQQSPYSPVRPMPRIIYCATDFVTTSGRDLWLKNTDFGNCHLIFCLNIDETAINNRFLCKTDNERQYYKISNLKSLLNRFTINIIDENFKKIFFEQRSITRIAQMIKPALNDKY